MVTPDPWQNLVKIAVGAVGQTQSLRPSLRPVNG